MAPVMSLCIGQGVSGALSTRVLTVSSTPIQHNVVDHVLIVQGRSISDDVVVCGGRQVKDLTVVVGLCGRHVGGIQGQRDVLHVGGGHLAAVKFRPLADIPVILHLALV